MPGEAPPPGKPSPPRSPSPRRRPDGPPPLTPLPQARRPATGYHIEPIRYTGALPRYRAPNDDFNY